VKKVQDMRLNPSKTELTSQRLRYHFSPKATIQKLLLILTPDS